MQQNVAHVPTGGIKIDGNASSHHEKQETISSSMGTGNLNISDGNLNGDLAMYSELSNITSGAFRVPEHSTDVGLPLKDTKNDANSVQGCFLSEDRVYNVCNEELVVAIVAIDAACNLYIPLQQSLLFF